VSGVARVRTLDGTVRELSNVLIVTDSLFGLTADEARIRVVLPLSRVVEISEKRRDSVRTLLLLAVLLVVAAANAGL
jgi:hypothetical protein